MVREESWKKGFYADNLIKYECKECNKQFIIGEEMLKDCPPNYPLCPYCGQNNVDKTAWTTDDDLLDTELGCVGLYIDEENNDE